MVNLGIIGFSEGNGHPFSFGSIINGYSDKGLAHSGWDVIYEYVRKRDASEFGFEDAQITHAWSQDAQMTEKLCDACLIPKISLSIDEMVQDVDAVILARDDFANHLSMSRPFLENGKNVFIDKPLTLDIEELEYFRPYLESGQLMSCSGLRFARELDSVRARLNRYGQLKHIRGAVLFNWENYGIHILEAGIAAVKLAPNAVEYINSNHQSLLIHLEDNVTFQIDVLGEGPKVFRLDIWGGEAWSSHDLEDNFSAFRRTLWHFIDSARKNKPAIPPHKTIEVIKTLIAGKIALDEKRTVNLNELELNGNAT